VIVKGPQAEIRFQKRDISMNRSPDTSQIFDFDVGYLMKSPCRGCPMKDDLPQCVKGCGLLKQIQVVLSSGVSSTRGQTYYTIHMPPRDFPPV